MTYLNPDAGAARAALATLGAENALLSGLTSSAAELNLMDGVTRTTAQINLLAQGVAAGYKVARGVHTQVAASDTVVTGLATVVAVIVGFAGAPTVKQLFCAGAIGNQAGAPAAGSVLLTTYKPTAVDNATPGAATDFTDNVPLAWCAIGT